MKSLQRAALLAAAFAVSLSCALGPVPLEASGSSVLASRDGLPTLAPMLQQVTPAVVNIAVLSRQPAQDNPLLRDPFFRRFFNIPDVPPQGAPRMSAGSGVIVDAQHGYVMTNNHVVANGVEVHVTLKDRRRFKAEVIGTDPATDIALLRIDADHLTEVRFGDSDELEVGDFVIAIGNPFGLGQTVTSGIVSALGRQSGLRVEGYEDFIQTDASINPGNSGGALVNLRGELIGINTAIVAPAGGNVGIGFAVPSDMAKSVMDQLMRYGEVRRGQLGVSVQDVTPDTAESLGMNQASGALINMVVNGSPAERSGLRTGDVILALDGKPVEDASDLRNRLGLVPLGSRVDLTVLRSGRTLSISSTVARQQPPAARSR